MFAKPMETSWFQVVRKGMSKYLTNEKLRLSELSKLLMTSTKVIFFEFLNKLFLTFKLLYFRLDTLRTMESEWRYDCYCFK